VDVINLVSGVRAIAAGYSYTCALTISSEVKCWGNNDYGQLGDRTTITQMMPMGVVGLSSNVMAITTGGAHTCALTASGGVKCWGFNKFGQLGNGTTINQFTPVDVIGLTTGVIAIVASGAHTCALTAGGGVKCWGRNLANALGDGTTTDRITPVDVSGLSRGISVITTFGMHTCALTAIGEIKCWGFNEFGQLGDATTNDGSTPVDVKQ
jgi:alpha-tubulin suppressor-like RCC1 family protein